MRTVTPGTTDYIRLGGEASVSVRLPAQGEGVAGVLLADPCVQSNASAFAWLNNIVRLIVNVPRNYHFTHSLSFKVNCLKNCVFKYQRPLKCKKIVLCI